MASQVDAPQQCPCVFRLFTKESLTKIERRISEEAAAKEAAKALQAECGEQVHERSDDHGRCPDPALEQGKSLPSKMGDFPPELFGKPIEEIDEYYDDQMVRAIGINVFDTPMHTQARTHSHTHSSTHALKHARTHAHTHTLATKPSPWSCACDVGEDGASWRTGQEDESALV